jgi:hypothetical protein
MIGLSRLHILPLSGGGPVSSTGMLTQVSSQLGMSVRQPSRAQVRARAQKILEEVLRSLLTASAVEAHCCAPAGDSARALEPGGNVKPLQLPFTGRSLASNGTTKVQRSRWCLLAKP